MSSVVFYKFKSQKEPSRIAFDGTGISVWELKKEIILESKLGKGTDFDFSIYNENDEEYYDDHAVIPRSTSVLARRLPPSKPGRGNGQIYMAAIEGNSGAPVTGGHGGGGGGGQGWKNGGSSMSKRFDGKEDFRGGRNGNSSGQSEEMKSSSLQDSSSVMLPAAASGDEANALAAMFAATSQQWQQTQEQMAIATPIYRAPMPRAPRPAPPPRDHSAPSTSSSTSSGLPGISLAGSSTATSATSQQPSAVYQPQQQASTSHKPPPAGYICYRCGQKGHWIQDCPTNSDRAFDDKPRIKRTTGIPKSFLTVVEGPGGDSSSSGGNGAQVMVTPDGGFVVARPDNDSWLAHRSLTANLSATDIQNLAPTDPDLTCPICSKLLRDSVLTPCCKTAFCEDCLHNALGDNDMLCPECESKVKNLGKLEIDKGRRERCKAYIEERVAASKEVAAAQKELEKVLEEEAPTSNSASEVVNVSVGVEEKKVDAMAEEVVEKDVIKQVVGGGAGDAVDSLIASVTSGEAAPIIKSLATDASNSLNSSTPTGPSSQVNNPFAQQQQQQQQFIQQQQFQQQQQQQQQRAMMMQQQQMSMGMGISPQMLQQQIYQINMNLSNPQLHPQMRMNLQMQLQQCQIMAVQMGLIPVAGSHTLGNSIAQAYGGNFANQMRNGGGYSQQQQAQQQQQQQQMGGAMMRPQVSQGSGSQIPTGPKRQRPEDFTDASPNRKRATSPDEVPQGAPPA